jgi:diadenosine tetraphosphate (Ap4A) HIT family hydrolase
MIVTVFIISQVDWPVINANPIHSMVLWMPMETRLFPVTMPVSPALQKGVSRIQKKVNDKFKFGYINNKGRINCASWIR